VKNHTPPISSEHPDALLLPYVEDMISPPVKAGLEEHLARCEECASRVEELREMTSALKGNKEAFCPELWELHDFARTGEDPHGIISAHVENCPSCSENLAAWKRAESEERMPAELRGRLRERLPQSPPKKTVLPESVWWHIFLDKLARFWKAPTIAAGAVAAVLLVVIFYRAPIEPTIPIPKSLPQKTAFVVLFKDFKDPALQKQIESIGEALSGSSDFKDRYDIVSPAETSKVIEREKTLLDDRSALIDGLRRHLNVSRVLAVTVFPSGDKLAVRVELVDTIHDKTLQTSTDENIERNELADRIRSDVRSMLLQPIDQP
jgi:uncharacterized protein with PIN domain